MKTWKLYPVSQFDSHQNTWDELNRQNTNSPLLEAEFVSLLIKYFSGGSEILAIAYDEETPVAATIIFKRKLSVWQTFQPSQAPVGLWVMSPEADVSFLTHKLFESIPGLSLILDITQLDPNDCKREQFERKCKTVDYIKTARITIQNSFEEYWTNRGKNLRRNMRRQRNKLKGDNIETRLEVVTDRKSIKSLIEEYGEMEAAGWKNTKGTAVHPSNAQGRFYAALLENYCARGCGVVYKYYFNNDLVAIDLCIKNSETLIVLKTTYDESYNSLSPALLLKEESFRLLFDSSDIKVIEFYGRVMDWHTKWSNEIRILYHLEILRWSAMKLLKR